MPTPAFHSPKFQNWSYIFSLFSNLILTVTTFSVYTDLFNNIFVKRLGKNVQRNKKKRKNNWREICLDLPHQVTTDNTEKHSCLFLSFSVSCKFSCRKKSREIQECEDMSLGSKVWTTLLFGQGCYISLSK